MVAVAGSGVVAPININLAGSGRLALVNVDLAGAIVPPPPVCYGTWFGFSQNHILIKKDNDGAEAELWKGKQG